MKILVCIKSVPDTETKIKIAADGKSADLTGAKMIISPMTDIIVSPDAEENICGAPANTIASASHGQRKRTACVMTRAFQ